MSPIVSKSQFRLMKAISEGVYPSGHRGISKEVADKYIRETKEEDVKNLVVRIRPKKEDKW